MARRSEIRMRMIVAARRLYRERGYVATALSDVLKESAAPRGSVYYHFPGGKEELGTEVALLHLADLTAQINRSALRYGSPVGMIADFIDQARDELVASGYCEGSAFAPIILEARSHSDALSDAIRHGIEEVVAVFAARLRESGVPDPDSRMLAIGALTAVEGALVVARSIRDVAPFDSLRELLTARVAALGNRPPPL